MKTIGSGIDRAPSLRSGCFLQTPASSRRLLVHLTDLTGAAAGSLAYWLPEEPVAHPGQSAWL